MWILCPMATLVIQPIMTEKNALTEHSRHEEEKYTPLTLQKFKWGPAYLAHGIKQQKKSLNVKGHKMEMLGS